MWLGEDDLEPEQGQPTAIEQPTNLPSVPIERKEEDRGEPIPGLRTGDEWLACDNPTPMLACL